MGSKKDVESAENERLKIDFKSDEADKDKPPSA